MQHPQAKEEAGPPVLPLFCASATGSRSGFSTRRCAGRKLSIACKAAQKAKCTRGQYSKNNRPQLLHSKAAGDTLRSACAARQQLPNMPSMPSMHHCMWPLPGATAHLR